MSDRREFLMLAHVFDAKKHGIGGWFLSEKIDGQRAFWDGGITRGLLKSEVPWANCAKDGRYVTPPVATGLWSRLGNVIHAPDWWLDKLPPIMMDGELWHGKRGHGELQNVRKIVSKLKGLSNWKQIKYYVFDLPSPMAVFRDGRLSSPHFKKVFKGIREWKYGARLAYEPHGLVRFEKTVKKMEELLDGNIALYHPQTRLPFQTPKALEIIEQRLMGVCLIGGEGLMLRKPESFWVPKRVRDVLKVKKFDDAEGIVIGYTTGRETDKGSKLLGMMGALVLAYEHPTKGRKRLEISGFTDAERAWKSDDAYQWAKNHPGQECPDWISAVHFPLGNTVTFRHRGWSLDGVPSIATYWRKV